MSNYMIGNEVVFDIRNLPLGPTNRIAIEQRGGVDGHALWYLGKVGVPHFVTTFTDVPTGVDLAAVVAEGYRALIGSTVPIRWAGLYLPKLFDILDVAPVSDGVRQHLLGIGGLWGTSYAHCVCQWNIKATNFDFQPTN